MQIKKAGNQTYAEVHQTNPIRWTILKKDGEDWIPQSYRLKCKDFFNEVVAAYHGFPLGCYGFVTKGMELYEEGVYVYLEHIIDMPKFLENVRSINKFPGADAVVEAQQYDQTSAFMLLPRFYFKNTYFISLLTYLIRCANTNEVITDWFKHPTKTIDNPFTVNFDRIMKGGFVLPIKVDSFYYVGKNVDYKNPQAHHVHNNGCAGWSNIAHAEGAI